MATLAQRLASTGKTFYMVSFTLRTGSTMLCDDLRAMDLGVPTEYFQEPLYLLDDRPAADYVMQVVTEIDSPWFGFKINWHQANSLIARLRVEGDVSPDATLWSVFPGLRTIHLVRDDKVLQAISAWRANESDVWHIGAGEVLDAGRPEYDFDAIKDHLDAILWEECLWEDRYRALLVRPLELHYEAYLLDRRGALERAAAHLGTRMGDPPIEDIMTMMRDDWSHEMARRFRLTTSTPDHRYYDDRPRSGAPSERHPMPAPRSSRWR